MLIKTRECVFLYIEMEWLFWLIVTLQSKNSKVLWFKYPTVNSILWCLPFKNDRNFEIGLHL